MSESFEIIGIHSVLVCPKDWDASMRFWRDALGLEVAADWSDDEHGAAALKFGDSHVIVAERETPRDAEVGFRLEPGRTYLYVRVRGLDALVSHLRSNHAVEVHGPVQLHWGPRLATARDPDGTPLLFIEGEPDSALVERHARHEK